MDEKLSLNDYDIKKVKDMPSVKNTIKYLPEKDLWVFERIETNFVRGAYLRKIQEANVEKRDNAFNDMKNNVIPVKSKFVKECIVSNQELDFLQEHCQKFDDID